MWAARKRIYYIKSKLHIYSNLKLNHNAFINSDRLRTKLYNVFLSKSNVKSKTQLVREWVNSKASASNEGDRYISEKRASLSDIK